jgi:hypothetical protein
MRRSRRRRSRVRRYRFVEGTSGPPTGHAAKAWDAKVVGDVLEAEAGNREPYVPLCVGAEVNVALKQGVELRADPPAFGGGP